MDSQGIQDQLVKLSEGRDDTGAETEATATPESTEGVGETPVDTESDEDADGEGEETERLADDEEEEGEEVEETEEESAPEPEMGAFGLNIKEFKEKYPTAFKEFPNLQRAVFHGRAMLAEFPSVEEAREARTKLENVEVLERTLMEGNPEMLLDNLHAHNSEAAVGFISNFLPTIQKKSPGLYANITAPIIVRILKRAAQEGETTGGDYGTNLYNSALRLNQFLFGKTEIADLPRTPQETPRERQLREKENALQRRIHDSFTGETWEVAESSIRQKIQAGIDKKVPENLRELTEEAIYRDVGRALQQDAAHMSQMNSLWRQARAKGLPREWKARIVSAYMGQAIRILPQIRQKHLQGLVSAGKKTNTPERRHIPASSTIPSGKRQSAKSVDWNATRKSSDNPTLAFLEGKAVMKK